VTNIPISATFQLILNSFSSQASASFLSALPSSIRTILTDGMAATIAVNLDIFTNASWYTALPSEVQSWIEVSGGDALAAAVSSASTSAFGTAGNAGSGKP